MTTSVLFDLDETLFDRGRTLCAFLNDQFDRFEAHLGDVEKAAWVEWFLRADNRGKLSKNKLYPQILQAFGGDRGAAIELVDDYYQRSVTDAQPMPGMNALLAALRARAMKIGIITNGETRLQSKTIATLNLETRVDTILISQAEASRKPEAEIFERALRRLGASARDSLFVGDDPVSDILGASRVGLQTVWFNPEHRIWPTDQAPNPGSEIRSLAELLALL